jgi:hypothetical protein
MPIPSTPTWRYIDLQLRISLSPSQQQPKNSPNQKSKKALNQKMGRGDSEATHPHKEKNLRNQKSVFSLRLFFKKATR